VPVNSKLGGKGAAVVLNDVNVAEKRRRKLVGANYAYPFSEKPKSEAHFCSLASRATRISRMI